MTRRASCRSEYHLCGWESGSCKMGPHVWFLPSQPKFYPSTIMHFCRGHQACNHYLTHAQVRIITLERTQDYQRRGSQSENSIEKNLTQVAMLLRRLSWWRQPPRTCRCWLLNLSCLLGLDSPMLHVLTDLVLTVPLCSQQRSAWQHWDAWQQVELTFLLNKEFIPACCTIHSWLVLLLSISILLLHWRPTIIHAMQTCSSVATFPIVSYKV